VKGNVRHGLLASLIGAFASAACGPAPAPKKPTEPLVEGPQPESTEWLYATPGSSGVIKDECRTVAEALIPEANCHGEFCQYSLNLGQDWLNTCKSIAPDQVNAVEQLVATMKTSAETSAGECGREGQVLIERGCPNAADCTEVAQHWATRCGEHATPLTVHMIEKQVERNTQAPVKLDVTSCDQIFAKVTETTECSDDFDCQDKLDRLRAYETRCTTPGAPVPLERGLKQALLLQSAKQPVAVPVSEARFAAKDNRLMLDDNKGFVVGVGDQVVPSVKLLINTLDDSEFALPVKLARVFEGKKSPFELRLGRVAAPNASTLFKRFPSLRFEGQREAQKHAAANRAITKLNEVVAKTGDQEVLEGLVVVLGDAALVEDDQEFRDEIRKADQHLSRAFAKLGRAKRQLLPSPKEPRERVAFARRNWSHPFADVTASGTVEPGAATPAIFANVEVLLPKSFEAYRKEMDFTVGRARRKLQGAFEKELKDQANALAKQCAEQKSKAQGLERQLLECAFAIRACEGDKLEAATETLDQALHDHEVARAKVHASTLNLEQGPDQKLAKAIAACQ